jgi:para-nitrobenzyl esterase
VNPWLSGFAALMLLACGSLQAQQPVLVDAPAGSLRGELSGDVAVFRGIPYAQAPLGDLRWTPPQAMDRWQGVRDVTVFGAACVQPPTPGGTILHPEQSEDCLFLNIWAPPNAQDAPVLFWIHGGSLLIGAGNEAIYDGASFAARGIMVVSINYRLGALGWLAHPALSAESPDNISGNYGLLDQVLALHWVQQNIAAFGGDPDNITIAGESAGALSVMYLLVAPDARGLFHRAIAQSPYLISMPELRNSTFADWPDAEGFGKLLGDELGAADAGALRSLSAAALVDGAARSKYFPLGNIDGKILPRQVVDSLDAGEQAPVPILAGYNEGEIRSLRMLLPPAPVDATAYTAEIRARYGDLADSFLAQYPAGNIDASMLATTRDSLYGWSAERLVKSQSAIGKSSYLYYFDHGYPAADQGGYRAFHASEIPFVFGSIYATPPRWPEVPRTITERRLSDAMTSYWASFVREGVPRAHGEEEWRPYGSLRYYLAFEDAPRLRSNPPNAYELQDEVICRRRAQGGMAWHWNVGIISPPLPAATGLCP